LNLEALRAMRRFAVGGVRLALFVSLVSLLCGSLMPGAGNAAVASGWQRSTLRPGLRVAALSILQYVQSQQLPNGRVRILLQFSAPVQPRAMGGATSTYVVQFFGASLAPTVPNMIPVNIPPIQSVSVTQGTNALLVSVSMTVTAQPKVINAPGNLIIIEVPQGAGYAQPGQSFQPQQQASASPSGTETELVRLRYADVSEVVGILSGNANLSPTNVFNPQPTNIGSQGNYGGGAFGQQTTPGQNIQPFQQFNQYQQSTGQEQSMGQRISDNLAVDRRLNALILTGTPQQIAEAKELISKVDIPVQSVLLDTEVLEVNETGSKSIGADFNQSSTEPLTRVFNTQAQILNNIPSNAVAGALAIQSNIWALVNQGKARVLASPKILTQDGLSASILTGDSLPIRVTTPVGVGGVGAVSSQVEYINVGVNLQILPRVTGNGGVDANIYSQVSSVTGFDSSGDPQISTRQAQTKVNLLEGQTLVIGGLLQQRDIRNLQKIWLLGDIPLLGYLFRYYTETKQNTNLVITVTPHVVPAPSMTGPGGLPQPGSSSTPVPSGAYPGPHLQ
jgi:general secretion pathway protein D